MGFRLYKGRGWVFDGGDDIVDCFVYGREMRWAGYASLERGYVVYGIYDLLANATT